MPRPRFEALSPERRARILDAAAAEFAEHGFARASYNQIIQAAGVSKGAMYYYFDDKEDLFVTTVNAALASVSEQMRDLKLAPFDDIEGFWRAIDQLTREAMTFLFGQPLVTGLAKAMLMESSVASSKPYQALITRFEVYLQGILEAGRAVGAIRDDVPDELLVKALLGMGEAIDRFLLANLETLDPASLTRLPAIILDLYRRLTAPADAIFPAKG